MVDQTSKPTTAAAPAGIPAAEGVANHDPNEKVYTPGGSPAGTYAGADSTVSAVVTHVNGEQTIAGAESPSLPAETAAEERARLRAEAAVQAAADAPHLLRTKVFESLGTASVCWEDMSGTGVFDDAKAKAVGDSLVEYIETHYVPRVVDQTIICPQCAEQAAVPINYAFDPTEKRHWRCEKCAHIFPAKEHA